MILEHLGLLFIENKYVIVMYSVLCILWYGVWSLLI